MTVFEWPNIDEAALCHQRWQRVQTMMGELMLDHLVLAGPDTIRYATGARTYIAPESSGWFTLVIDREGQADLFVPYTDDAVPQPFPGLSVRTLQAAPAWAPAGLHPQAWARRISQLLTLGGARRVGLEGLTGNVVTALAELAPSICWQPVERELYTIRREKLPAEIRMLEAVNEVNSRAVEAALRAGQEGARDYDFLAAAAATQLQAGVEAYSHGVCNVRKLSGDWYPDGTLLRPGDAFMFDIGCYGVGGYASDLARVGFVGEPSKDVQKAYRCLLNALELGEQLARPGVRASSLHVDINNNLTRFGYPPTPYSMGHGIGLRLAEPPTIYLPDFVDEDATLRVGDVIALEPETTVQIGDRKVVLKIEDNYVVEKDGLRRLSNAPR